MAATTFQCIGRRGRRGIELTGTQGVRCHSRWRPRGHNCDGFSSGSTAADDEDDEGDSMHGAPRLNCSCVATKEWVAETRDMAVRRLVVVGRADKPARFAAALVWLRKRERKRGGPKERRRVTRTTSRSFRARGRGRGG